jgi:hypothetical protein
VLLEVSGSGRSNTGVPAGTSPGPGIRDEAGQDGDAQKWRLGRIDLEHA